MEEPWKTKNLMHKRRKIKLTTSFVGEVSSSGVCVCVCMFETEQQAKERETERDRGVVFMMNYSYTS